jgi:hypothetical protein
MKNMFVRAEVNFRTASPARGSIIGQGREVESQFPLHGDFVSVPLIGSFTA